MEAALTESTWQSVRERLESERRRINDEIEHYPPPIPRCDAQFNYLLEARANIARELSRLEALALASKGSDEPMPVLEEFIRTSQFIH